MNEYEAAYAAFKERYPDLAATGGPDPSVASAERTERIKAMWNELTNPQPEEGPDAEQRRLSDIADRIHNSNVTGSYSHH